MRLISILVLIVVSSLSSTSVLAASMRCEGKLVTPGQRLGEVVLRCGQPIHEAGPYEMIDKQVDAATGEVRVSTRTVQELIYDLGSGRFRRTLEFHNGVLVSVRTGQRSP